MPALTSAADRLTTFIMVTLSLSLVSFAKVRRSKNSLLIFTQRLFATAHHHTLSRECEPQLANEARNNDTNVCSQLRPVLPHDRHPLDPDLSKTSFVRATLISKLNTHATTRFRSIIEGERQ
jgi:hypothetical protein